MNKNVENGLTKILEIVQKIIYTNSRLNNLLFFYSILIQIFISCSSKYSNLLYINYIFSKQNPNKTLKTIFFYLTKLNKGGDL